MKKVLLSVALLFTSSVANAAGLYLSAGYGVGDPDMSYSTTTCASDDVNCYGDAITLLPGWPGGTPNAQGYEASAWAAGLKEEYFYNTEDTSTTSFAIGWAIPKNPFRFEAEYQKTKFKSPNYVMRINDPNGKWCESGGGVCVSTPYYDFDVNFYQPTDINVSSYMANVYFDILKERRALTNFCTIHGCANLEAANFIYMKKHRNGDKRYLNRPTLPFITKFREDVPPDWWFIYPEEVSEQYLSEIRGKANSV